MVKNILHLIFLVFVLSIALSSCSYNSFEDKFDENVDCSDVTYSGSIAEIISVNCAVSGCHAGPQFPDFRVLANIQANASNIKIRTQNRSMPKSGSLTQQEIDLIGCWVDNGALDN